MRLTTILAAAAVVVISAGAGYAATLAWYPYHATDVLFAKFKNAIPNHLPAPSVRNARTNLVVADNADTLTQGAILDLSKGPVVFEADVPADAVYWSVSLFAHNTDTFYVANDRKTGPGPFRLLIRKANQTAPMAGIRDTAVSPTNKDFLIVRYTMCDRNDAPAVAAMKARMINNRLTPVTP